METKKSYSEQLKNPRWQKKRLEIMERDYFTCSICGDNESTLVVHHKKYITGKNAWEYDNYDLITLCITCHDSIHNEVIITENNGCINPQQIIENIPNVSKYFSEIGNHKGYWTLKLRKNADHEKAEEVLFMIMGYAFFDDSFEYFDCTGFTSIHYDSTMVSEDNEFYLKGTSLNTDYK